MRLTQQEADPIGAITAAQIVVIGAVLSFGTSLALTWVHRAEIVAPAAAIASIVLVAAAGVVAAISAAPSRAPFTAERLWLVVTLAVGAAIAEYMSTVGSNQYLYDDFGPVVIGMLILSVAPFCTWLSLALAGVLASIVLSILVVGASAYVLADAPVAALIAINAAPVIALTAAAAGYAYAIIAETLAWQREANRAALQRDAELRAGIARSVQQSRVSVLGRAVLPFLAGVRTAERISVADADRARELAEELRRALRAGIESTWLDDLAANLRVSRGVETFVDDPTGAADLLGDDQRSALTALITWLAETGRSERVGVSFAPEPGGGLIRIVADPSGRPPAKRELDRFVAVARAVALGAESVSTRENVSVELRYVIE
ncbi:MAG TPA: hypothetical protein VGE78_07635 [Agromyces sp.]